MTMQERRCGFCSQPVDGKTTDVALPSEAVAAHPASFVVPLTSRQHEMIAAGFMPSRFDHDNTVYRCNDGEGCNK